jgi:hypothetical protein
MKIWRKLKIDLKNYKIKLLKYKKINLLRIEV